ncbi:MAG: ShlB/FhaC/HecB family hemolysin secretion/activation protein [Verrucomicrobiota bacterium]|nr:ShlB/FhaC/HecB family hemolysin secretion/activation protein [Verrucomicrobiota bacterium]
MKRSIIIMVAIATASAFTNAQEQVLPPLKDLGIKEDLSLTGKLVINEIRFDGNGVYSDEELRDVISVDLSKPLSTEDLEAIRKAVSQFYFNNGYVNSGAMIGEQDLSKGVLTVSVVEGVLDKINIMGTGWLRPSYVEKRIRSGVKTPLSMEDLKRSLEFVRRDEKIRKINTALLPGDELGQSHLDVIVTENKLFDAGIGISNRRPPSVGAEEAEVYVGTRNLTSLGDTLRLNYTFTDEGMDEVDFDGADNYAVSYSLPLHTSGTSLELGTVRSDYVILEEPFDTLNIESDTQMVSVGIRQPIYNDLKHEFSVSLKGERRRSETMVSGMPFSISPGSTDGMTRIAALRLSPEYVYRSSKRVIAVRTTLSFGLDTQDPVLDESYMEPEFFSWLTQASWVEAIGSSENLFALKSYYQHTDERLISMEQFSLGGMNTIRGYRENQIIRDNAFSISPEIRIPILRDRYTKPIMHLIPFFDYGIGWNAEGDRDRESIYSLGLGLAYKPTDYVNMSLYWGYAFEEFDIKDDDDLQDYGIHFQVRIGTDFLDPSKDVRPDKE